MCPLVAQLCFVLCYTDDPCFGPSSSQPHWRLHEQSLQLNDRGDFIRVIEFNYPFLELMGGCKANSPTLARSARGCLLWRAVCLVCSEPGFHVPSANTQRYSSSPHCQAHFKPCWVVSLNPRQWIPTIRSHKSALFWSDFHLSCFLSPTPLFPVPPMTRSPYCHLQ